MGAILATFVLKLLFSQPNNLGVSLPASGAMQSFWLELIMSFLLMFTILNVSTGHKEKGIMAGVAIGGVIALESLFGGPVIGAYESGPFSGAGARLMESSRHMVYLTAPFIGTFLAVPLWRLVQGKERLRTDENGEIKNA